MRVSFIFLFLFFQVNAQDTLRIYFEFGSSKVNPSYHNQLFDLASNYDLSQIDSVQFIGYADSVGNWNANVRLSKKRAKNTYKLCKRALEKKEEISILARGEGVKDDPAKNRRVEIVLHYSVEEEKLKPEIIESVDPKCFFVDFVALQSCNVRTIKKKKREMVYIEALDSEIFTKKKHYYVKKDLKGKVNIQRLKWRAKTTGKLWWKKKRLVTTLPAESFEKFQFFTLEDAPCDGCKETIFTKDTVIMNVRRFFPDRFLMANMQAKVRFFGRGQMKVRVPREYVDINDSYFYSSQPYHPSGNYNLSWTVKRAKRKQPYYYTRVNILDSRMPYIKRSRLTTICVNTYEGGGRGKLPSCRGVLGWPALELQLNIEPGVFYHNDSVVGFLSLGTSYTTRKFYMSLQGGVNTNSGFFGMGRIQYHFFSFPFQALNPFNTWGPPTGELITTYGRLYIGSELKTSFNKSYQSFFENNLHLGLCLVNTKEGSYLPRVYLEGGYAKDFMGRINQQFYPFVQLGVTFNLNPIFIRYN